MVLFEVNRADAKNNVPDLDNKIPKKPELEALKEALIRKGVISEADVAQ